MARNVSLLALGTILAMSAGACASAGGPQPGEAGGVQYQVLVINFQTQGVDAKSGAQVAAAVRDLVNDVPQHEAVSADLLEAAKTRYGLASLDSVSATQLAQQVGAELVVWGSVSQGSSGVETQGRLFDVRTSDHYTLASVNGENAKAAGQALGAEVQQTIGGIALAITCNEAIGQQQYDVAIARCDSALAMSPNSGLALQYKASALMAQQNYSEALSVYTQLMQVRPDDADAALRGGLAAVEAGQDEQALPFFEHFRDLNQADPDALVRAAGQIAQAGDYVGAFTVVQPAIDSKTGDPTFDHFLFSLGTAAGGAVAGQGDSAAAPYYTAALTAYKSLAAADTVELALEDVEQAILLSSGLGHTDEAIELARDATVKYDTVAALWAQYGQALSTAGRYSEAVQALGRLIQLDPNFENAYLLRGLAYSQIEGQEDAAIADLQQAASRGNGPKVGSVLYSMGAKALQAENWDRAASLLEMAQQYATGQVKSDVSYYFAVALYNQGSAIVTANGSSSEALALFRKALTAVNSSSNAGAQQLAAAIQQYIDYLSQ